MGTGYFHRRLPSHARDKYVIVILQQRLPAAGGLFFYLFRYFY
jgi:hypothetical protein